MIGMKLSGRYHIIKVIGGGGMAHVYLAHDLILDRDVAVKVLRTDMASNDEFVRRFIREGQAASSLNHPNIVNLYDVGDEKGVFFLVMEYIEGMTLKEYINYYAPIPNEKVIEIMKQLTSAVSNAHQNQIIHRDIKPQNILIDRNGIVKITDFGIATAVSGVTIAQTSSQVLGSVHYLSPEQVRGGQVRKESDIYSMGIVMYELLTGRLPFSGDTAVSIGLMHLQQETPPVKRWNAAIPQSVENVVLKATAKDPSNRYTSADELLHDLETVLDTSRMFESRYVEPKEGDVTKVMPTLTKVQQTNQNVNPEPTPVALAKQPLKEKRNHKKTWITIGIIAAVIAFLLAYTVFFTNIFGKAEITVPNLKGKELDSAISILKDKGFLIGETVIVDNSEVEEGCVTHTDPEDGKVVKTGTKITIYYSKGIAEEEVGSYEDHSYEDLKEIIEDAGFKDIEITYEEDKDVEPGMIMEQDPQSGEKVVFSETILKLTVCKASDKITLRDLKDYGSKALTDYATEVGITIKTESEEYSETIAAGSVISQNPPANTPIEKGSEVKVVISKGKEDKEKVISVNILIPVPSDPGTHRAQIYMKDKTHTMDEPVFDSPIVENTTKTFNFTVTENISGKYRVVVDNKIIEEKEILYK
jgi:serine/threonine-protein kinase